jgi:hypothetical protein
VSSYKLLESCFLRKGIVDIKEIATGNSSITKIENSGTVGVGLGEVEVEVDIEEGIGVGDAVGDGVG